MEEARVSKLTSTTIVCAISLSLVMGSSPSVGAVDEGGESGYVEVDEATFARVDAYLEEVRSELGWPGLAAAVVYGGNEVFLRGYGVVEEGGDSVTPETMFLIASVSKSITALALIQLVEKGLVDLDGPITAYLPELSPGGDQVSVRGLMHHRSGLTRFMGNEPHVGPLGESLEANVARLAPLFVGGAQFAYSNANYDTMALIVERVSGLPFSDYVRRSVFEPLGMANSAVGATDFSGDGLAAGYYHTLFMGYQRHDPVAAPGTAGSYLMFSSAADLSHLLIAHINEGAFEGSRVALPETMAMLHEPEPYGPDTVRGYAGGWSVEPPGEPGVPAAMADYTTLWHDGSSDSYRSLVMLVPDAGLGVVLLVNANDVTDQSFLTQAGFGVKRILAGEDAGPVVPLADFLTRWGKHLLLTVVVGQFLFAVWVRRPLAMLRARRSPGRGGWARLVAATALDLAALGALILIIPAVGESPLRVVASLPDYRILIGGMMLGVVWGAVRTALVVFWRLRPPQPSLGGVSQS